jgi:hypothetical protein
MDEARIREIIREEIEAVESRRPTLSDVQDEKFSDDQKLGLVQQNQSGARDGARLKLA